MTTKHANQTSHTASTTAGEPVQLSLLDTPPPSAQTPHDTAPRPAQPAQRRSHPRVPGEVIACGWCATPTPIPARGRPPKWCSPTCRHRAWEQRRAASSGLAAVEIIERAVETVKVETHHVTETIEVPVAVQPHTVEQLTTVLTDLAHRLDTGRLYDRDLSALAPAVTTLIHAMARRTRMRK